MATAVEVEQGRNGGGLGEVALGLGGVEGLKRTVEAIDVRLVVLAVVQLHNLARDVGLERAIVVWKVEEEVGGSVISSRNLF